jgi:hypothetical protein
MCFSIEDGKLPVATNKAVEAMGRHNAPQLCWGWANGKCGNYKLVLTQIFSYEENDPVK